MFDYIPSSILPLGFIMFILSTVGIIGNIIMVYCSIFSKKLRSPCHILISITCLLDGLHISGQLPFCVHLFGNLTSSQAQCFYMLLLPIIGFTSGGPMILAMGIDRFVAVRFPSKYRYYQEEPTFYIIGQLIFPIGFILFFLIFGFFLKDVDAKNQIICANPLSLNGMSFQVFTYSSALIYISVFFLYLSVYLMLKSNKTSARFKRVFRSLAITVGLVLFGWATTTSANTLSYLITDDKATVELIQMYAGITVNAAAASNIFVFYAINSEYREIIRTIFGWNSKPNNQLFEPSSNGIALSNKDQRKMSKTANSAPTIL